ncbi:MAG: hypothetical protein IPL63_07495 [Saprospiraceae bacterium]|nr:hypothetical protein [Saprospiraceae bacterium]MBK6564413.1 hypothetical protein [Saprospiraceae bacterium]MBK7523903.1 hypothetical protein [Saprospiraceae bacterium]MBK8371953.1 hypothetical protein [Saprospiraceae bacterium]MBK8547223.1 hypothetical protein [Saprospiraceae bacterium]
MYRYLLVLGMVWLFTSCEKDTEKGTGNVDMVFLLQYKGEPLVMFDTFFYPVTGEMISFTKFATYISDITFQKNDNSQLLLKEIDYLDMTNAHNAANATKGFTYKIPDIPEGSFSQLRFGIGVSEDLNAMAPKDFPSNSVLSSSANYWTSWKSYIFSRTEGKIDFNGDNKMEDFFTLHAGGNDAYTQIDLEKTFTVTKDKTTTLEIVIDIEKYLNGSESLYDIRSFPSIHSLEHIPVIKILSKNMKGAVSIR